MNIKYEHFNKNCRIRNFGVISTLVLTTLKMTTWLARTYFYSKTNQMQNISNLFYFGTTLYMFRTVSPSIIRSLRLYIQHQVHVLEDR
jgi:hypothetical protein